MLKVEPLNIVVIAGASLGVVCTAGLAPVSGLPGCVAFVLFAVCLVGSIVSHRVRVRDERRLLAELQEHRAALGSPASPHLTIASAALALVDAAERAMSESAAQVAELKTQVDALRVPNGAVPSGHEFKHAFVTRVSHELRTPLAGIKAYVELLIDGEADDDQTRGEFYQVIYGEADRLSRLIDDIVAVSRIETGVAKPQKRVTSVARHLDNALARVGSDLRQKNVSVTKAHPAGDYQTLADPTMLEQALVTLLINAIKFSPTGGGINVEIGMDPHQKTVLTRILDQGPGVEPQDVPGLFDKFDGARTCARTAGGAGIALALVRQIVEVVHGGSVVVESGRESGCCFEIRLPLYAPEPAPTADELSIR